MEYQKYQTKLLTIVDSLYSDDETISECVKNAFLKTPRHLFVDRFKVSDNGDWIEITESNLSENLSLLYANQPLLLFNSSENNKLNSDVKMISTISQPSFVLRLLDLLDIKKGHHVFELGTASGWNAALISTLVGENGKVFSVEIISELADSAKLKISEYGYKNIYITSGDGGDGSSINAPYDRVMFTAGAFDLPQAFHSQVKTGGLLMFALKISASTDYLCVLKKHKDHFSSIYSIPSMYVPMTGKYYLADMEDKPLSTICEQHSIEKTKTEERQFWWGASQDHFLWETSSLCSYLSLFDNFVYLREVNAVDGYFAWIENNTIAVAQPNKLTYYGGKSSENNLTRYIENWIKIGMPTRSNLHLSIYPNDHHSINEFNKNKNTWIITRKQSTFVWQLPRS